jgi:hypothetical protein
MSWTSIILYLFAFYSLPAMAVETAGLRGLQSGPIGEGYVFESTEHLAQELQLSSTRITGKEESVGQIIKYQGETLNLKLASGFRATDTISIVFRVDLEKQTLRGESASQKKTHKASSSEIRAAPNIWIGDLLIGAEASALHLGKDILSTSDASTNTETTTDAVTFPRLRLFTGIKSGTVSAMVRSLLYNHGNSTLTTISPLGTTKRNTKRRTAAETSIDTKIDFNQKFSFAGSVSFVDAERASNDSKNSYYSYGIGGLYTGSPTITVAMGLTYTDPHYKRGADASIIDDNLGGLGINLGARYNTNIAIISFETSYIDPESAEYQTDISRNNTAIERARSIFVLGVKSVI